MEQLILPPLILYPLSNEDSAEKLAMGARASAQQAGFLPSDQSPEAVEEQILAGRYAEIHMLCKVGQDLKRWIGLCMEATDNKYDETCFVALLITRAPVHVVQKLRQWGVTDYQSIFSRALALNETFLDVPPRKVLTEKYIKRYHHFADIIFKAVYGIMLFPADTQFDFELFAAGEYDKMLERQWELEA